MRQSQPELLGRLKTNDVGAERWEFNMYRMPGGTLRLAAQKATVVGKTGKDGKPVVQLKLVNADGTPA